MCSKCISHYITDLIHRDFHNLHMMLKSYDVNMGYIYCYFQFTSHFALKDLIWQTLWHWVINQEDIFSTDREKREDQITFYFLTFWSFDGLVLLHNALKNNHLNHSLSHLPSKPTAFQTQHLFSINFRYRIM